jgi:predicted GIY-YIG superfamily endonuclease
MPWKKIDARDGRPNAPRGTVYLLHFSAPIGTDKQRAQHYIGWAEDLSVRLDEHLAGRGARIVTVARERGVSFVVAKTWPDATKHLERKLKNRGGARTICPVCRGT